MSVVRVPISAPDLEKLLGEEAMAEITNKTMAQVAERIARRVDNAMVDRLADRVVNVLVMRMQNKLPEVITSAIASHVDARLDIRTVGSIHQTAARVAASTCEALLGKYTQEKITAMVKDAMKDVFK